MKKPGIPISDFMRAVDKLLRQRSEEDPERFKITCQTCGQPFVAKHYVDIYICPFCEGEPIDAGE
ncbi:MAG: hypothetical protein MUC28_03760 [Planctomycetes bacterium]|jgi:ribosomal protein L37AE/L43A|nr:hypothetical protein [Planctomycetota bacterium]